MLFQLQWALSQNSPNQTLRYKTAPNLEHVPQTKQTKAHITQTTQKQKQPKKPSQNKQINKFLVLQRITSVPKMFLKGFDSVLLLYISIMQQSLYIS